MQLSSVLPRDGAVTAVGLKTVEDILSGPFDSQLSLYDHFKRIADALPDAPAILYGDDSLTYAMVMARTEHLARHLIDLGVAPASRVGIVAERGPDAIIAMLATVRIGASYTPLVPTYHEAQIGAIAADIAADALIADPGLVEQAKDIAPENCPVLDAATEDAPAFDGDLPAPTGEDIAYILYTSGSTGKPKGVRVRHRGIARIVYNQNIPLFVPNQRVLNCCTLAGDISAGEIWGALLSGGTVAIVEDARASIEAIASAMERHKVHAALFYPGIFHLLIDSRPDVFKGVRIVTAGGDTMSATHVRKLKKLFPDLMVGNKYGPTETTIFTHVHIVTDEDLKAAEIPLGHPIAHTESFVLDENLKPVQPGEQGECVIGGHAVAAGYLDQPEMTAETFIDHPVPGHEGKVYLTGDMVELREDGNILFRGRVDRQIKLGGRRIELDEIEISIRNLDQVADTAVVVGRPEGRDPQIVAFLKPAAGAGQGDVLTKAVRAELANVMPDTMIPRAFVELDELPLSGNGKIDRKTLLADWEAAEAKKAQARKQKKKAAAKKPAIDRRDLARFIEETWCELIGVDQIGPNERFFEVGGTSLVALKFIEMLRQERGLDLSAGAFFDIPTIEGIVDRLTETRVAPAVVHRAPEQDPAEAKEDRIAIIGLGARTAGAETAHELWEMLLSGKSGRIEVTADDMIASGKDPALLDDPDYVAAAYPLKDYDKFDTGFFGYTPREIQLMDPQQRIFLEAAWMALEDAGHDTHQGTDRIGVFGGVGRNAYQLENLMSHKTWRDLSHDYSVMMGNERDFLCTHVAYRFGLTGPALTVQTGCSTSGVAIHMAVQGLKNGDCDMALAGGAKFLVPHRAGYMYIEGGPLSPDGRVKAFDHRANGMIRGSGVAMLALKRLDDALEDGDHIYASIIGSALNNDGENRAGFTAPSALGQAEAIAEAYDRAQINAETIGLIEAHGTGTFLGDPIEIEGLTRAFAKTTDKTQFCAIGSIKTNIGHLDAGATAAGVVKAALALKHEKIPPSLNFEEPNPRIPFEKSPLYVADHEIDWARGDTPRRAGISSFGLGGTNAHILIEEAPEVAPSDTTAGPFLFVLSAKTDSALEARRTDLADWLDANPDTNLADVAWTLLTGRRRMGKRIAFLAETREEVITRLRSGTGAEMVRTGLHAKRADIAFLFPGNGTQYQGMGIGLYETSPAFRDAFDPLEAHYAELTGLSLLDAIREGGETLDRPGIAQPALFAVEYATAAMWMAWGAKPQAMIGHSLGEYTAACLAGVFTPQDAMTVVTERGRLTETLEEGAMLAVTAPAGEIRPRLPEDVSLAAINAPEQCVVSGPVAAVHAFEKALEADEIETRMVPIKVGYHSTLIDAITGQFQAAFDGITLNAPAEPFVSTLSGDWITDGEATSPKYWVRHLRETVQFADGISNLLQTSKRVFLELGPGRVLSSLTRADASWGNEVEAIPTLRHMNDDITDTAAALTALGQAWMAGATLDWRATMPGSRMKLPLPVYRFDRERQWIDAVPYPDETGAVPAQPAAIATQDATATDDTPAEPVAEAAPAPAAPVNRRAAIEAELVRIVGELSGLDQIDVDATFFELGFDSLFLTQANAAFKKAFKLKLTTRQLMETTPSVTTLADYLEEKLAPGAPVAGATPAAAPAPALAKPAPTAKPATTTTTAPATTGKTQAAPNVSVPSVDRTQKTELTPAQQAHIDALIAETNRRTPTAKASTQKSRTVLADPRTIQGFKSRWKEMVYPILSDRAKGARVWDMDGNEYIDLVGGYGVAFLGHQPDFVTDAIRAQMEKTLAIGPQTPLAGEVAQMISEMTGMERVAFCNTGSEAVLAAVRMARTVTGKDKIVKFDGHYHGIFDEMQVRGSGQGSRLNALPSAPGIPQAAIENTILVDYGDPDAFEVIRENMDDIALVLVEPVRSRNPDFQPVEYVQALRKLTTELGIPLLFDEMITGFRSHPKGAQHFFGIEADLATYGKVVGGGLPIGVVAGKSEYMDTLDGGYWEFGDDSAPPADMTWFAGTFVRHPLALATAKASLGHMIEQGPSLQEGVNARARRLADELNAFFEQVSAPLRMECFSSVLRLTFTEFSEYADLLFFHMRNRGIMTYEGRPIFLSTAHTDADIDAVRDAFIDSLNTLIEVGLMKGTRPDGSRVIPLAPNQQEIWIASQFSAASSASYNLCSTIELKGRLDRPLLQQAITALTDRHEALRTVPDASGETQTIHARVKVPFKVSDLSMQATARRDTARQAAEEAEVQTPFDLTHGPLVRAHLMKLGEDHHKLLLSVHHVIADGWSCGIMVRELGVLYAALRDGVDANLPAPLQLSDYLTFLDLPETVEEREEARAFWLDLYKDGLGVVEFPSDRPRPRQRSFAARRTTTTIPADTITALTDLAKSEGTTLFAALIGGFGAYLTRISGATENALGFAAAGQPLMGSAPMIGHCVTFLPMKISTAGEGGFAAHVKGAGNMLLDALENQNFDFASFVKDVDAERDLDWAPIVTIGVNLDGAEKEAPFADFEVVTDSVGRQNEQLDMFINFVKTADGAAELQCTYNTAMFNEETMVRRMAEYRSFLSEAAKAPKTPMAALELIAPKDHAQLEDWRGTTTDFPADSSVPQLFHDMASLHATDTALVTPEGDQINYAALDTLSDTWADHLAAQGVGEGDFVAVCMPRSAELIVALLAVLKAGAVFVPLETDLPKARLDFILADCGAAHLLSKSSLTLEVPQGVARIDMDQAPDNPPARADRTVGAGDPAYLMYTSGSTGQPKGVLVPHRAIVRLVRDTEYVRFDDTRVFLQLAPIGFDAATFEIWGALLNGATLIVAKPGLATDLPALKRTIADHGVTTLWLTAALFNTIVDSDVSVLEGVDELLTGGEALSVVHVRKAQAALKGTTLINGYGPTENTTFSCTWTIPELAADATSVPIGRPIANTRAYIVDTVLGHVPPGVPGELVVAGPGLALGYLNRPDLNESVFVPAPALGEERVYRTGDICRFRDDGVIEFLGRRDGQVKIRGFRIEPGEIEAVLANRPEVDQAAIIYSAEKGALFGFYTDRDDTTPETLMSALSNVLPRHMLPTRLIRLDAMPVSLNGKLDRSALAEQIFELGDTVDRTVAKTSNEVGLVSIWRDLLGVEDLYAEDDFFKLGGHSLMAVQLFDRIREQFGVSLPISTLFAQSTISGLARTIEEAQHALEGEIDANAAWDPSVIIHHGPENNAADPIFIVGGAGGNVNNLAELGRFIGKKRKVIAFQTRGVLGHTPHGTIEAMARDNLSYLKKHWPDGPVSLAGYSAGATTAFEMARQLEAEGRKVRALILIDSMAPGIGLEFFDPERTRSVFKASGRRRLKTELRMALRHAPRLIRRQFEKAQQPAQGPRRQIPPLPRRHKIMVAAWFDAARKYKGGHYGGRASLLLSTPASLRSRLFRESYPDLGWGKFITGGQLTRHQMNVDDHEEIVTGEYAVEMAQIIEAEVTQN